MSAQMSCPGCMLGDHSKHVHGWDLRPGVIGGWYCGCAGDCKERFDGFAEKLTGMLTPAKMPTPSDDQLAAARIFLSDSTDGSFA